MISNAHDGPCYPRLLRGVVQAQAGPGLVVEGGPRRRLLSGDAAGFSWSDLLSLLDGTRSIADCATELGVPDAAVAAAVRTLDDSDLIEAGSGPTAGFSGDDAVANFLSRSVTVTRSHDNGQLAARALSESVVILAAPPPVGAAMHADARATGVGAVFMRAGAAAVGGQDLERARAARPRCVVAAWDGPGEAAAMRRLERACAAARVPLLRFASGTGRIEVGPLFFAEYTACYSCFADGYAPGPAAYGELSADLSPDDQGTWLTAALVLREVLAVTGQLTVLDSYRRLTVIALDDLAQRRFLVTRRPGCPDCASGQPQPGPAARAADAYEWQAESAPSELGPPPRPLAVGVLAPAGPGLRGSLLTSPRYALPAAAAPAAVASPRPVVAPESAAPRLGLDVLAALLERVAGGPPDANPGIGNYGSTELLLVTGPGWAEGPGNTAAAVPAAMAGGGVFRYDSQGRELSLTQRSGPRMPDLLTAIGLPAVGAPLCLLVFVAALWRLAQGHGALAYRVAHLDAGGATGRLSQAAADYGLHARFAGDWAERLTELLELHAGIELPVAIAGLYPGMERKGAG